MRNIQLPFRLGNHIRKFINLAECEGDLVLQVLEAGYLYFDEVHFHLVVLNIKPMLHNVSFDWILAIYHSVPADKLLESTLGEKNVIRFIHQIFSQFEGSSLK